MSEFHKAAKASEIQPGSGKVVSAGGKDLALFNLNGDFFCIDNTCVHRGGPLGDGFVQESTVVCPWHGWQYEIKSGECKTNPAAKLACYQVRQEGDDILISV